MLRLHDLGWGTRRIAREFGCGRNTVRRYLESDGWAPYGGSRRGGKLDGLDAWLRERFFRLRATRMWCARSCRASWAWRRACARWSGRWRRIGGGCGRRRGPRCGWRRAGSAAADRLRRGAGAGRRRAGADAAVRGDAGLLAPGLRGGVREPAPVVVVRGAGGGVRHFGGVPEEVLVDNAKALVEKHDAATREVEFNDRFWRSRRTGAFRPRACAPYRARTKGKDERGVRYVKGNAIAGREFESLAALRGHQPDPRSFAVLARSMANPSGMIPPVVPPSLDTPDSPGIGRGSGPAALLCVARCGATRRPSPAPRWPPTSAPKALGPLVSFRSSPFSGPQRCRCRHCASVGCHGRVGLACHRTPLDQGGCTAVPLHRPAKESAAMLISTATQSTEAKQAHVVSH